MRRMIIAALALLLSSMSTVRAGEYTSALEEKGFTYCAVPLDTVIKQRITEGGVSSSYFATEGWDNSTVSVIVTKRFHDGVRTGHFTATKLGSGGCDVSYTVVSTSPRSCSAVREEHLVGFKFKWDLDKLPVYEDDHNNVVLMPLDSGCQAMWIGTVRWNADAVTKAKKTP